MSGRGLILAAHGSRYEPAVNSQIRGYAASILGLGLFDEVAVAFHQGPPSFSTALDGLRADEVVVVPVMTSAGYYSDLVLPRELRRSPRYAQAKVLQTMPLGLHPKMGELVAHRIDDVAARFGVPAGEASVAIVGHGTPRHAMSRCSTETLADELARRNWPEVLAAFIDEEPFVEEVCTRATQANVIVIPFLIGAGPHAVSDIPARLGLHVDGRVQLPVEGTVQGRRVICDAPLGVDPRLVELIVDLATSCVFGGSAKKVTA